MFIRKFNTYLKHPFENGQDIRYLLLDDKKFGFIETITLIKRRYILISQDG